MQGDESSRLRACCVSTLPSALHKKLILGNAMKYKDFEFNVGEKLIQYVHNTHSSLTQLAPWRFTEYVGL